MTSPLTRRIGALSLFAFALTLFPIGTAHAQTTDAGSASPDCGKMANREESLECARTHAETRTIFLKNVTQQNDANDIMVAVRNSFDPSMKLYLIPSQNALVVTAYPQELAKVEDLVRTLDRPARSYRLTYTLTDLDGGKTVGTQHYSMTLSDGQRVSMKEGSKVPIATGTYSAGAASSSSGAGIQTQFTYLDIGMNFDATIVVAGDNIRLKSKVEESSLDKPVTISDVTEPVVRQSVLDGTSVLTLNKPIMLGSIDVPNTTRHIDIAVVAQVK